MGAFSVFRLLRTVWTVGGRHNRAGFEYISRIPCAQEAVSARSCRFCAGLLVGCVLFFALVSRAVSLVFRSHRPAPVDQCRSQCFRQFWCILPIMR